MQKPIIPNVAGIGKLPRGWRLITGADGKPYYWHKKTGEVSWEPPPPDAGEDKGDIGEAISDVKGMIKDGWRRTKQQAAVKLFQAASTGTDHELDGAYEKVQQLEKQILALKTHVEGYLKSLVEMCYSGEQLTQTFADYVSEPGCELLEPARHAASVWHELQKGAQRALDQQFTNKVLQPVVHYLGEIEGIKKMHEAAQKRKIEFDYYRRKMTEMQQKPPNDGGSKVKRNTEKLQQSEVQYLSVNNELKARVAALLAERWDFAAAPLTQLIDFQGSFYSNIAAAVEPLAVYSSESKLLDAEARLAARETLKTEALTTTQAPTPVEVSAPRGPQIAQIGYAGGAVAPPPAGGSYEYAAPPAGYTPTPVVPPPASYAAPPPASYAAPPPASYAAPPPASYAAPPPSAITPMAPPVMPPAGGGTRCRAVSDYAPSDPRMISVTIGEIIMKQKDEGGWFFGSNSKGEEGYFPASYVEPC